MSNPYQSPQSPGGPPPRPPGEGDATGGVIPYKNMPALLAYYIGIVSLLCCFVGLPVGIASIVLGILGLQKRARQPEVKGSVHAWIGIVCGVISTLGALFVLFAIIAGMVGSRR
jgi:F0F1-type ATP synthase membrane subunit c/vacuolar-type H+-ATPase subunit K